MRLLTRALAVGGDEDTTTASPVPAASSSTPDSESVRHDSPQRPHPSAHASRTGCRGGPAVPRCSRCPPAPHGRLPESRQTRLISGATASRGGIADHEDFRRVPHRSLQRLARGEAPRVVCHSRDRRPTVSSTARPARRRARSEVDRPVEVADDDPERPRCSRSARMTSVDGTGRRRSSPTGAAPTHDGQSAAPPRPCTPLGFHAGPM